MNHQKRTSHNNEDHAWLRRAAKVIQYNFLRWLVAKSHDNGKNNDTQLCESYSHKHTDTQTLIFCVHTILLCACKNTYFRGEKKFTQFGFFLFGFG